MTSSHIHANDDINEVPEAYFDSEIDRTDVRLKQPMIYGQKERVKTATGGRSKRLEDRLNQQAQDKLLALAGKMTRTALQRPPTSGNGRQPAMPGQMTVKHADKPPTY